MIYPSANGNENVILFHKAAVIAKVKRPEGVEFRVRDL
jgi:hypothetical protein